MLAQFLVRDADAFAQIVVFDDDLRYALRWKVYPMYIQPEDHLVSKTYMTPC